MNIFTNPDSLYIFSPPPFPLKEERGRRYYPRVAHSVLGLDSQVAAVLY